MSDASLDNNVQKQEETPGCSGEIVCWCLLALIISIIVGAISEPKDAGFWRRTALIVVGIVGGTPLGTIGALIGSFLRKIAAPDFIMTSQGMSGLLKERIFWAIGPQSIGMLIGTLLGCYLTVGKLAEYWVNNP